MSSIFPYLMLVPVVLIGYAFFCNARYLIAIVRVLRHVAPGRKWSYFYHLSLFDIRITRSMVLPEGLARHDEMVALRKRGITATLLAAGSVFLVVVAELLLHRGT